MLAGNQPKRLLEIRPQLVGRARLARIVAGRLDPAAGQPCGALKPPTSSPCQQCSEIGIVAAAPSPLDIHAHLRIPLAREPKLLLNRRSTGMRTSAYIILRRV